MSNKPTSVPSIEDQIEQVQPKDQYINNLKAQCRMQEEAFNVAQSLITTYKKQNQELREQIKTLKALLQEKQDKISIYQEDENTIKTLEKNILKYSEKVNHLLEQNLNYEQKIRSLERDLDKQKQQHHLVRQEIKQKLMRQKKQLNQRKELQGHFHNFLKLPGSEDTPEHSPKQNRNSVGKQSLVTAVTKDGKQKTQSKVLEWKLKQKDEEIVILLKRLKDIEERGLNDESHRRRERFCTSDSVQNYYSNKKKNISEFTH